MKIIGGTPGIERDQKGKIYFVEVELIPNISVSIGTNIPSFRSTYQVMIGWLVFRVWFAWEHKQKTK
jgi:hypothetical protein